MNPSPDPSTATSPKKTNPWLIAGIGCGGVLVFVVLVAVTLTVFLKKQVEETVLGGQTLGGFVADMEAHPEMTAAEMIVRMNPDIELVSSDRDAKTFTIRQLSDGQEITVNLSDVQEGKLRVESATGEETVLESAGESLALTTTTEGVTQTVTMGEGTLESHPQWVTGLIPPGGNAKSVMHVQSAEGQVGAIEARYSKPAGEVAADIEALAGGHGLSLEKTTFESGDRTSAILQMQPDEGRSLTIQLDGEQSGTKTSFSYSAP